MVKIKASKGQTPNLGSILIRDSLIHTVAFFHRLVTSHHSHRRCLFSQTEWYCSCNLLCKNIVVPTVFGASVVYESCRLCVLNTDKTKHMVFCSRNALAITTVLNLSLDGITVEPLSPNPNYWVLD